MAGNRQRNDAWNVGASCTSNAAKAVATANIVLRRVVASNRIGRLLSKENIDAVCPTAHGVANRLSQIDLTKLVAPSFAVLPVTTTQKNGAWTYRALSHSVLAVVKFCMTLVHRGVIHHALHNAGTAARKQNVSMTFGVAQTKDASDAQQSKPVNGSQSLT